MIRALAIVAALTASQGSAQDATEARGAVLRSLDKVNGNLADYQMSSGEVVKLGRLEIKLNSCRYPTGNPAGDAYASLEVRSGDLETPLFEGWMIASSPALNALDHPRYDVWVLRCITS